MANKYRGEVNITLAGEKYVLRPTFEALCELEERAGEPILSIMSGMQDGKIRLKDMALIIWSGMYGYDAASAPSIDTVGAMILETGLLNVMQEVDKSGINPVTEFLMNGILGGEDPVEEEPSDTKKSKKVVGEANA